MRALREGGHGERPELAILDGFLGAASRSIDKLAESIDPKRFRRAVAILAKAETVYLIARRRSFPLTATWIWLRQARRAGATRQFTDWHRPGGVGTASKRDAVIAMSFATYSDETVALAHRGRRAPLDRRDHGLSISPLAEVASQWLEVAEADHAGFRSLSASMALCMALTVAVANARDGARNERSILTG